MTVNPITGISDEARRCSDAVNLAVYNGHKDMWMAVRLSDGGTDDVIYDTKRAAVAHQLHESQCFYVKLPWDGMSPRNAQILLTFYRKAYAAGFRQSDPDIEPVMPYEMERHR